jgi:hypothetical protein
MDAEITAKQRELITAIEAATGLRFYGGTRREASLWIMRHRRAYESIKYHQEIKRWV